MAEKVPQSIALEVMFMAYLASDHITPATGKTIAITISKNHAALGNPSGGATNATAVSNGCYYVALSATDTGTLGNLWIHGAEGTIDDVNVFYRVVDPNNGGLAALPAAAAEAAGGLYTRGSGAGQINQPANGQVDINVVNWKGSAAAAMTGDAYAVANTRLPAALTANGNIKASLVEILTTALTETAGLIAAAFKKFFNVATPTGTVNSIPDAVAGASGGLAIVGSVMGKSPATLAAADVSGNIPADVKAVTAGVDFSATMKASITAAVPTAAQNGTDAASKVLVTPAQKIVTDVNGYVSANVKSQDNIDFGALQKASITAAVPTAAQNGTDAASKILVTPAQKIVTDASGYVTANLNGDLTATMKSSVNAEVDTALNTAIPGGPTADSINERIAALDDHITADYGATEKAAIDLLDDVSGGLLDIHTDVATIDGNVDSVKTVTDKLDTAMEADVAVYRFTANALEQAPVGGAVPTAAQIADAVWDEAMADHVAGGSTGEKLNGASAPSAASVADAVWDEAIADHSGAGSTGLKLDSAASAGDPWSTAIPGAYGAGTAGKKLADLSAYAGTGDTAINHNTGGVDALRYMTAGGDPIDDGQIRAYLKADYDAGDLSSVKAASQTGADGRWTSVIMLDTGFTYTLVFYKQGYFAPTAMEITI